MMLDQIVKKQKALATSIEKAKEAQAVKGTGHKTVGLQISEQLREEITRVQKAQGFKTYKEAVMFCIGVGVQALK